MKRLLISLVAVIGVCTSASAQTLMVTDLASARSSLVKTYGASCKEDKQASVESTSCIFNLDPNKPRDFVRVKAEVLDTGDKPRYRRQISILITPGLFKSEEARSKYGELAKQIALPTGGALADKLPTPDSVIAFCRSRPEAEKGQGCTLNELENPKLSAGLFIMSDADAFYVSVTDERDQ